MSANEQLVWHYTVEKRWTLIKHDGFIKVATAMVLGGEAPAAWFSSMVQHGFVVGTYC
jgi:hypothetical protein